jgi:hypothetical protein
MKALRSLLYHDALDVMTEWSAATCELGHGYSYVITLAIGWGRQDFIQAIDGERLRRDQTPRERRQIADAIKEYQYARARGFR